MLSSFAIYNTAFLEALLMDLGPAEKQLYNFQRMLNLCRQCLQFLLHR